MANSFHSGFFEEMKRSNRALIAVGKTMLKGGSPLEPIQPIPNPTKGMKLKGRLPMRKLGR